MLRLNQAYIKQKFTVIKVTSLFIVYSSGFILKKMLSSLDTFHLLVLLVVHCIQLIIRAKIHLKGYFTSRTYVKNDQHIIGTVFIENTKKSVLSALFLVKSFTWKLCYLFLSKVSSSGFDYQLVLR